jgi:hypothetical protein
VNSATVTTIDSYEVISMVEGGTRYLSAQLTVEIYAVTAVLDLTVIMPTIPNGKRCVRKLSLRCKRKKMSSSCS